MEYLEEGKLVVSDEYKIPTMINEFRFCLGLGGRITHGVANGEAQPLLTSTRTPVSFLPGPTDILAIWLRLMAFTVNMLLDRIMYGMAVFTEKLAQATGITNLKLSSSISTHKKKHAHFSSLHLTF